MKKIKLFTAVIICTIFLSALSACGDNNKNTVLKVGATAVPHAVILEQVVPILAQEGIELIIVEFDDYILPNLALKDGEIDVNYFQHRPFLTRFNTDHNANLQPVFGVHFEPLRLYASRFNSLENIPLGATIAIPDDPSNEARALQLLEALGLIKLTPGLGLTATHTNIIENPYNLNITPIDAPLLSRTLPDVDFAVINGNFALQGGVLHLAIEGAAEADDSEAAVSFTNFLVAREGYEDNEAILALIRAISSETIKQFINERFLGGVVPQF